MISVLLSKNESNHRQKQSYDNVSEFQLFNLGGNGHLKVKVISEKFNMLVLCWFVQA
jgi:stress-induced morphogen